MNMQTIQIFFLLFDSMIKLAPWRIVTETMERMGYGASEGLARSLGVIAVIAVVGAMLYVFPPTSIVGPILLTGCFGGVMMLHLQIGGPPVSHILFGFVLGLMVWGGLRLCHRSSAR
jgi:hypothetical protein